MTEPRDTIDALAEVLRLWHHGGARRPLWSDMVETDKDVWRERARFVSGGLARRGFALVPAGGAPLSTLVELRETLGLIFDDSPEEAAILAKLDAAIETCGGAKP